MPYIYGNIDLRNFKPHRKNPHIANVFSQTIMVEELGSGAKRIFKYTPLYANGQVPEIYEDDYFTIIIPTPFVLGDTNNDTINRGSDTINIADDTINGASDTNNDTINSQNVTINSGSDTINGDRDTINGDSDTIKLTVPDLIVQELRKNPYMTATELGFRKYSRRLLWAEGLAAIIGSLLGIGFGWIRLFLPDGVTTSSVLSAVSYTGQCRCFIKR